MIWTQTVAMLLGAFLIGLWSNKIPEYAKSYNAWKSNKVYNNSLEYGKA